MIDLWFEKDLQNIYDNHSVAVFIDESGDAEFLLNTVKDKLTIYQVNSEIEELHVKYLIEKVQPSNERFLIYTNSKKAELKFIREYCEIYGCLKIRYFENYIKEKVHKNLNENINLTKEELISAAKVSIGKDKSYWRNLISNGPSKIFDLNKELLPFVHDPENYINNKYDIQLQGTFYGKVNELLDQDYLVKPAATLANEVVNTMLDGLVIGDCNNTLMSVYKKWLDSVSYRNSFDDYRNNYKLSKDIDIWDVSIDHPFRQIDDKWIIEIGENLSNKIWISNILSKIDQRNRSKQAQSLEIYFWDDVIKLLEFDSKDITYLSSFEECVEFYKSHFCKLDTAIRNLYVEFLNKKELLVPFQELYKEHVSVFLDKWFNYWDDYKENQSGLLQQIIDEVNGLKTAVIVGDGVTYEIAELVADKVKGAVNLNKDSILADIPSETENNMSRIYMDNGVTEAVQSNREKYLVQRNPDISIDFLRLDEVHEEAHAGQLLICTYKDIDDMGEKLQQKALKYFPDTINFFAKKISLLLSSGYSKVYLITDHGFVLTGLLSESDKISVDLSGEYNKAERYIRTKTKQPNLTPTLIESKKSYKQYEYLYQAKNMNPFKTTGLYGFSHGGVSPQELIIPYFCWEHSGDSISSLSVYIENKEDLKDVTGELYPVKIKADKVMDDMFSLERRVYLIFFTNKKQINKSDIFSILGDSEITKEYTFDGHSEIEVHLLDAVTKEKLDFAVVKKNNERDLGGLF